jgi:hypothetical protein
MADQFDAGESYDHFDHLISTAGFLNRKGLDKAAAEIVCFLNRRDDLLPSQRMVLAALADEVLERLRASSPLPAAGPDPALGAATPGVLPFRRRDGQLVGKVRGVR